MIPVNKKTGIWFVLLGGILLLFATDVLAPLVGVFSMQSISGLGASILSVQNVTVVSNDPELNGQALHIVAAADGSGNGGVITFTPQQALGYGISMQEPVIISAEQSCEYRLKNASAILVEVIESTGNPTWNWDSGNCQCVFSSTGCSGRIAKNGWSTCGTYQDLSSCTYTNAKGICAYVGLISQGSVYEVEPVEFFKLRVNISLGDTKYSVVLSPDQKSAINGILRAYHSFSGVGYQTCAHYGSELVAYVPKNSSAMYLKSKDGYYNALSELSAVNGSYSALYLGRARLNTITESFINSQPFLSQYCPITAKNTYAASFECTPESPAVIPVLDIYVKGGQGFVFEQLVGKPMIINVSTTQADAAQKFYVDVAVLNSAQVPAAFDASVKTAQCPSSVRESFNAGEQKVIKVPCQGAGIVSSVQVTVNDINNPSNSDSETIRLDVLPICSRIPFNPKQVAANTEYGCFYLCPNQHQNDTNPYTCEILSNYDRCTQRNESGACMEKKSYEGYHCLGIGKYASTNSYMDLVFRGKIPAFVPEIKSHQIFLQPPYCAYVDEYGYENGMPVDLLFNYERMPTGGEYQTYTTEIIEIVENRTITENIILNQTTQETPPDLAQGSGLSLMDYFYIIVIVIALIAGAKFFRVIK